MAETGLRALTDEELADQIRARCSHGDVEAAHSTADGLIIAQMRALGYTKAADAWKAIDKWYA